MAGPRVGGVTKDWARARLHVVTGKGGTGKTTVAAALALALASSPGRTCCWSRSRAGRASARCSTCRRCRYEERRIAAPPPAAARSSASRSTPRRRCSSTSRCSTSSAAPAELLEQFGAIDFATTIAPGRARRAAHRQGLRGGRRRSDGRHKGDAPPVYDAVVLDAPPTGRIAPVPRGQLRGGRPRQGGPDRARRPSSITRLLQSDRDGGARGDPAGGDAGAGDRRRDRRAARARACPVGAVVVNMVREPLLDDLAARARPRDGPRCTRRRSPTQLADAGVERDARARRRPARGGARPRRARRPRARAARARSRPPALPIVQLPALAAGVDSGSAARARRPSRAALRGLHRHRPGGGMSPRGRSRARRPGSTSTRSSTTRRTEIVVCCGSGGVGKTTTAAALGAPRRRARPQGRRADHRPGPAAGPVAGHRPSSTTPRGR